MIAMVLLAVVALGLSLTTTRLLSSGGGGGAAGFSFGLAADMVGIAAAIGFAAGVVWMIRRARAK